MTDFIEDVDDKRVRMQCYPSIDYVEFPFIRRKKKNRGDKG